MSTNENSRRSVLKSLAAVSGLAAAAIVAPGVANAATGGASSAAKPAHGALPTVVLVHGAWADGSCWTGVIERLQRAGYPVDVPPNPLRSLTGDSATIADYLSTRTGPIVLVGHSYGGAVITNAALGNPNVTALVYINAFAPAAGENVVQLATEQPGSAIGAADPTTVFTFVPYPGAPAGDVDLYILPSLFPHAFANDLPARTGATLAATQRPLTYSASGQASGTPAWQTIPSWYLVGTADNVIPPAEQRIMARRANAHTVEVRASHLSMISRPDAVTDLIVRAARGVA
jgi:pimeloyl-ACP methyl ester carboxylesterase